MDIFHRQSKDIFHHPKMGLFQFVTKRRKWDFQRFFWIEKRNVISWKEISLDSIFFWVRSEGNCSSQTFPKQKEGNFGGKAKEFKVQSCDFPRRVQKRLRVGFGHGINHSKRKITGKSLEFLSVSLFHPPHSLAKRWIYASKLWLSSGETYQKQAPSRESPKEISDESMDQKLSTRRKFRSVPLCS